MDLQIDDVAEMLNVGKETILRWLKEGRIPSYKINGQDRFSRDEIESWMIGNPEEGLGADGGSGIHRFSLYRAMHKGGISTDVPGETKDEIIRNSMELAAPRFGLDANVLTELLLDRERLMPTALGNGLGVPHTRDFLLKDHFDVVFIAFPKKPIDYGALDQKPVHTLFFLLACDDKRHLNLLAKIAHLASNEEAMELIRSQPEKNQLLSYIREWESQLQGIKTL